MKKIRNTKTELIGHTRYCSFCAKEAQSKDEFDHYEQTTYYFCDCEASQLYLQIEDLQDNLDKMTNKQTLNRLRYEEEIKWLKIKHNIE